MFRRTCTLLILIALAFPIQAEDQSTDQPQGLRENVPNCWAITNARLIPEPGRVIEQGTIVIRHGRLEAVGAEVTVPEDARVVDLSGKTIYAGLIDSYAEQSASTSGIDTGFPYWNSQIRPQLNIAGQLKPSSDESSVFRKQGVTARLIGPSGGIFKGAGAILLTNDASLREAVIRERISQHIRLTTSRGRNSYPNSPMGAVALARQAMYDAEWYSAARQAVAGDPALPQPDRNDALAELNEAVSAHTPFLAETSNELFALRADEFAREFGLNLIIVGSGNEYRRLEEIRSTGRAVLVPVNFPKAPNVGTAEAAMEVSLETLMHWDHAPENPARLEQAGVRFAFCSHGLSDRSTFLSQIRKAVSRGLSADAALAALTTVPAGLFDLDNDLGTLHAGKLANLVVTDGDLFSTKSKIVETWVSGHRFEHTPAESRDPAGNWTLKIDDQDESQWTLQIKESKGKLTGSLVQEGQDPVSLKSLILNDARLSGTVPGKAFDRDGIVRFTVVISADNQQGVGHVLWPDESLSSLVTRRVQEKAEGPDNSKPEEQEQDRVPEGADGKNNEATDTTEQAEEEQPLRKASFAVNFPLGAFGVSEQPEQPRRLAITGATIWTCTEAGIIEDGTVLIENGKITRVGKDLKIPRNATVIDGTGMHLTPGIIDCHSHMGTDGGINESGQAVTSEVRIGDFINCDDINIYRQLAGGVTTINILHGSANPIGGQNQVVKLRWGGTGSEMKFAEAPAGIKFALGENVKQSNWDSPTGRYPQTRMGVEQLFVDEFRAAQEYMKGWNEWKTNPKGLPPRRDLELDAIAEILRQERWIHCHSYRQDEILALIRVTNDFGIQIATLQHILEGYKVADEMARNGIMGSAFSDWWAYKFEVIDAIPYAGALMHEAGVVVSFNSDDRELARHLNHEAAKAVKYGGVDPAEALKFVTLNPARQLRIDKYVGSIQRGRHADFVLWSGSPLSPMSRCEQTWIDGRKYFDRSYDETLRVKNAEMRAVLIQKILDSSEPMADKNESSEDESLLWPSEDEFCVRNR